MADLDLGASRGSIFCLNWVVSSFSCLEVYRFCEFHEERLWRLQLTRPGRSSPA